MQIQGNSKCFMPKKAATVKFNVVESYSGLFFVGFNCIEFNFNLKLKTEASHLNKGLLIQIPGNCF